MLWIAGLLLLVLTVSLYLLVPTHEGRWAPAQAQLPLIEQISDGGGRSYRIQNLRDFRYAADGSIAEARYYNDQFAAQSVARVWLGISHFGPVGLAHVFLSFEFDDGRYLVASVEARLKEDQYYSPVRGVLRQYHKIIVLGTEADIIGLRSHIRGERVLLYPLLLSAENRQFLFNAIVQDAAHLQQAPGFYNTLIDNCLSNLVKHDPGYRGWLSLTDYRLLLPGFSDGLAYERGWLYNGQPLEELREAARIDGARGSQSDPDFSQKIRRGVLPD